MTVKPPRAAMISWRPGSGTDAPSAAAMVAKSSPKAKPTEAAAQALSTLDGAGEGERAGHAFHGGE